MVNVTKGATLTRNAKYLKHAPKQEDVIGITKDEQSDGSDSTSIDSSETSQNNSAGL